MPWCPKCGAEYVENVRKCLNIVHSPCPFYHRLQKFVLVSVCVHLHFLVRMAAIVVARNITGNHNHRNGIQ